MSNKIHFLHGVENPFLGASFANLGGAVIDRRMHFLIPAEIRAVVRENMVYTTFKMNHSSSGVLTLSLNRPEVRNAFNQTMIQELATVFQAEVLDPKVRVVVLRGEGPVFCAGGDLNWMKKSAELNYEQNLQETLQLTRMFSTLNECPKPLIGVAHGAALGGGVGLVSVCDSVVAVRDTEFSLSEVRLGIVPACIGPFVVNKIGTSNARKFFVSAERFKGERAQQIGLVHDLVDRVEDLEPAVNRITSAILASGPRAVQAAKNLVLDLGWPERRAHLADPLSHVSEVLASLRVSKEGQEGLRAFLEKRKPNFDGTAGS